MSRRSVWAAPITRPICNGRRARPRARKIAPSSQPAGCFGVQSLEVGRRKKHSAMDSRDFLCTRCLETIAPVNVTKGSFWVELALWLTAVIWLPLILLGIGYSIWRLVTRGKECPQCSSTEFVPVTSERARQLRK